jgi:hypothetical protein
MRVDYALGFLLCGVLFGIPIGMVLCDVSNAQSPQYYYEQDALQFRQEAEQRLRQLDRELWNTPTVPKPRYNPC